MSLSTQTSPQPPFSSYQVPVWRWDKRDVQLCLEIRLFGFHGTYSCVLKAVLLIFNCDYLFQCSRWRSVYCYCPLCRITWFMWQRNEVRVYYTVQVWGETWCECVEPEAGLWKILQALRQINRKQRIHFSLTPGQHTSSLLIGVFSKMRFIQLWTHHIFFLF